MKNEVHWNSNANYNYCKYGRQKNSESSKNKLKMQNEFCLSFKKRLAK